MTSKKCKICYNNEDKCVCNESEEGDSEELIGESDMEEGREAGDNREQGEEGDQSEAERQTEATPAPQGAGNELSSSLDDFPGTQLASRPEAREGAMSRRETDPLPQRPAVGSRRPSSLSRKPESAGPADMLAGDGGAAPPDSLQSSPTSEEDMDLATLIPAQKRLKMKLANKKAKKLKAKLMEKPK